MIGAMGPNISSWDTGMSFVTSAKNMRGQDWPSVAPPVITRAPDLRAPAICSKLLLVEYAGRQVILEIEHAGELRLVHQGRAEN
jgi:hypothetical protein